MKVCGIKKQLEQIVEEEMANASKEYTSGFEKGMELGKAIAKEGTIREILSIVTNAKWETVEDLITLIAYLGIEEECECE